ncbi:MAG: DUF502 domain-containing protein [Selenomonadaceae bacterium]|nr:DUF502 domain-containing protein [Selenomonadaceae bacterium]MBQ3726299.1 DUF502 domain-containing protein [Selenomonadaceae bacterium]
MDEDNKPKSFTEQISSSFFKGLLIVVPPAITVFVVTWLFELTEDTIGKYLPAKIPGAGLAIVLVGIWIVGVLSGNFLSKKILEFFDGLISKIPVVKFIYKSVKQVSKAVFESDSMFKSVVLVPYQKSYVLGFQILNVPEPVREKLGEDYVCVYMPWSMNMTAGMNFFVKKSDVIQLDMLPQDALQFILTAGTISAAGLVPTSLDKLKPSAQGSAIAQDVVNKEK